MKYIEKNIISIFFSAFVLLVVTLSIILTELSYKYLTLSFLIGLMTILILIILEYVDLLYFLKNFHIFLIFTNFLLLVFLFTAIPIVFEILTGGIRTVSFFFLVILVLLFSDKKREKFNFNGNYFEKLSLSFLIISFFISTLIFNPFDYLDIYGGFALLTFIISPIILFYYFPRLIIKELKVYSYFILMVFSLGFFGAVYGLITVVIPETNPLNTLPGFSISIFQHPNANAFLYGYSIPVTIYIYMKYKDSLGSLKKGILISSIILMIINQLLTRSRSGNITMLIGIFIFLFFYSRKLSVVFIIIIPIVIYYIFQFTTEKGAGTVLGRVGLLFSAFEMISSSKEGMLWGFGISSYSPIYETFKSSLWVSDIHNYPHNSIVFLVLRFGVVFTVSLIIFILYHLSIAIKNLLLLKINLDYTLCLSICSTVLVQSILEDFILFPEYYLFHFFLVFFGLLVLYNKNEKSKII